VAAVVSRREILRALEADEFVLHFQPIVDLQSGQPRGAEALIRWDHPLRGLLPPDEFLPAIAQTPVVASMTQWVLHAACTAAVRWPDWTLSVNITARDVASEAFADQVLSALDASKLPADRLVLELTETALVQDLPRAARTLGELRDHGVGVALDDFGTGYSSMLYLRELPVTSVKIDRVFTSGLRQGSDDLAIVSSLLTLARTVGLTAVAEGVETEPQARLLSSLGCPLGQGYLWSKAVPVDEADAVHRNGFARTVDATARVRTRHSKQVDVDSVVVARVQELLARGASLHTIAAALNASGERTASGSRWHPATVARLINRTAAGG
jgi:EAL domain-containing protein (putative c-di-GMP-specific phosphodiesterase class I)